MKGLLIFNNKAGGAADELLPHLKEALGGEVISATLEDFECLSQIPQRALEMGCQWVAAAGGDGTIGCVAQKLIGTELPLGVIPIGTFNNFARSLGLPLDPIAACRVVRQGNVELVDVAFANGKPFFECLGTGLDAALFPMGEQIKSGRFSQWLHLLRIAILFRRPEFMIELDRPASEALTHHTTNESRSLVRRFSCVKDRIIRIPALMVTVSNGPYFGMNFAIAPEERMDDGLVTVSVFHRYSKMQLFARFLAIAWGRHSPCPKTVAFRVAQLKISATAPVAVHLDGTPTNLWPLNIQCQRGALSVFREP